VTVAACLETIWNNVFRVIRRNFGVTEERHFFRLGTNTVRRRHDIAQKLTFVRIHILYLIVALVHRVD